MMQTERVRLGVRLGWWSLGVGLLGLIAAYAAAMLAPRHLWPAALLALAIPTATVGITLIAVGRRARRPLVLALFGIHALLAAGLAFAVADPRAADSVFGAVPRATIVVLLTAGVVPLILLPALHVGTFRNDLTEAALTQVRNARRPS